MVIPDFPARVTFSDEKGIPTTSSSRWMAAITKAINFLLIPPTPHVIGPMYRIPVTVNPLLWTATGYGMITLYGGAIDSISITRYSAIANITPGASIIMVAPGDLVTVAFTYIPIIIFLPS